MSPAHLLSGIRLADTANTRLPDLPADRLAGSRTMPPSLAGPAAADGRHVKEKACLEASPGIEPGCKDLQSSA